MWTSVGDVKIAPEPQRARVDTFWAAWLGGAGVAFAFIALVLAPLLAEVLALPNVHMGLALGVAAAATALGVGLDALHARREHQALLRQWAQGALSAAQDQLGLQADLHVAAHHVRASSIRQLDFAPDGADAPMAYGRIVETRMTVHVTDERRADAVMLAQEPPAKAAPTSQRTP